MMVMPSDIQIRPARPEDAPALAGLRRRALQALDAAAYSRRQVESFVATLAPGPVPRASGAGTLVAEAEGQIVASVDWSRPAGASRGGDPARVGACFVEPGSTGRGLGRTLVAYAERACGFPRVELWTCIPGEAFCRRLGYRVVGRRSVFADDGQPLQVVQMAKVLSEAA